MQPGITISAPSRGHFRDSSMSSLESWTASSDGIDQGNAPLSVTSTPQFPHFRVLASNSPDIRDLCKSSTAQHSRNDSIMSLTDMHQADEKRNGIPYWNSHHNTLSTVTANTQPVSFAEDDRLVESITRGMEKFQFYSPQRTPLQPSCDIKKPTRHRRVSYEMLPSMTEIALGETSLPPKGSPALSRHRRNTTHLVLE